MREKKRSTLNTFLVPIQSLRWLIKVSRLQIEFGEQATFLITFCLLSPPPFRLGTEVEKILEEKSFKHFTFRAHLRINF